MELSRRFATNTMKTLLTLLLAICAATGYGQTIKSLGYNTTNGQVVYSGTNRLTFTNTTQFVPQASPAIWLSDSAIIEGDGEIVFEAGSVTFNADISFVNNERRDNSRANLSAAKKSLWAYKTSNQTNDTGTLINALSVSLEPNLKYAVTLAAVLGGSDGLGHNAKIVATNASKVIGFWRDSETAITNTGTIWQPGQSQGNGGPIVQQFVVVTGTNSTTLTFQFASQTLAYEAIVKEGTYFKAEVIEE
jgi:hypothetical protein